VRPRLQQLFRHRARPLHRRWSPYAHCESAYVGVDGAEGVGDVWSGRDKKGVGRSIDHHSWPGEWQDHRAVRRSGFSEEEVALIAGQESGHALWHRTAVQRVRNGCQTRSPEIKKRLAFIDPAREGVQRIKQRVHHLLVVVVALGEVRSLVVGPYFAASG